MNVTKPEKVGIGKKGIIIYGTIIFICIVSLCIAFYVQFYKRIDLSKLVGINQEEKYGNKTEDEMFELESSFLQLFNNNISNANTRYTSKKLEQDKDMVYTAHERKELKSNSYDIEVHIPKINIQGESINQFNNEIDNIFIKFLDKILQSENRKIIYTVDYTANVQDDILSLMIYANFKEGTKAQKVIIKTYNYDLRNNKKINLKDVIRFQQLDENKIQKIINSKIEAKQKSINDLQGLGYSIYSRDLSNDIYKIKNTEEFYLTYNVLYVIYPYGNNAETSEMDLVIL